MARSFSWVIFILLLNSPLRLKLIEGLTIAMPINLSVNSLKYKSYKLPNSRSLKINIELLSSKLPYYKS